MATYTVATVAARLVAEVREFRSGFKTATEEVMKLGRAARRTDEDLGKTKGQKAQVASMKELAQEARSVATAVSEMALTFQRSGAAQKQMADGLITLRKQYASLVVEMRKIGEASDDKRWVQMADKFTALNVELVKSSRAFAAQATEMGEAQGAAKSLADQAARLSERVGTAVPVGTEKAKNKLRELASQAKESGSSLRRMAEFAGGFAIFDIITTATSRLKGFVTEAVFAAGRSQELAIVLNRMGDNANVSTLGIEKAKKALIDLGIESGVAQDTLTQFMRYGLDVSRAPALARAVQDMAVIAGLPSSETLDRVMYGIVSRQTEVLRTAGVNVSQEKAFATYAKELGKTASALTEVEKQQAMVNAVIADAANVQGVYEESLTSGYKAYRSLSRYASELTAVVGDMMLPVFDQAVFLTTALAKAALATFGPGNPVATQMKAWITQLASPLTQAKEYFKQFEKSGMDLSKVVAVMRQIKDVVAQVGAAGKALAVSGIATWLAQLPGLGSLLGPLAGVQGFLVALIVTNEDLRNAFARLIAQVVKVAAAFVAALAPAVASFSKFVEEISPSIAKVVDDVSEFVTVLAGGLLGAIKVVVAALDPMLTAMAFLVKVLAETKVAAVLVTAALVGMALQEAVNGVLALASAFQALAARATAAWAAMGGWVGLGIAAAIAGFYLLSKAMADTDEEQKRLIDSSKEYWNNQAGIYGYAKALQKLKGEMDIARAAAQAIDKELGDMQAHGTKGQNSPWWGLGIIKTGKASDSVGKGTQVAKDPGQAAAFTELLNKGKDAWLSYSTAAIKAQQDSQKNIESSMNVIDAVLQTNSMSWIDYSKLTTSQIAMIEDKVTEFASATEQWTDGMTSIAEGLKQKEVMGFNDLLAYYETQRARVEYFWSDLSKLMAMGLNQSAVEDLIKAGPMAVGDAMGNLLKDAETMGGDYAKTLIQQINSNVDATKEATANGNRAIVEQLLMGQGAFKASTAEEMKTLTEELTTMKQSVADDANAVTSALIILQATAANTAKGAASSYNEAVQDFLSVATDASATAEQVQAALAQAAQLGKNVVETDPAQKAMIDQVNAMLAVIAGNQATMHNAGVAMGVNFGNGLAAAGIKKAIDTVNAMAAIMMRSAKWMDKALGVAAKGIGGALSAQLESMKAEAADTAKQVQSAIADSSASRPQTQAAIDAQNKAAQEAARASEDAARTAADNAQRYNEALANMDWVGKWKEAFDDVIGVMMTANLAKDRSVDAVQGFGKSISELGSSSLDGAAKVRGLRKETYDLVGTIAAEAEAMAKSGAIGKDAASINEYLATRLEEVKQQLPGIVQGFNDSSSAALSLTDRIKGITDAWDQYLGVYIDANEAEMARKDSFDKLNQAIADQRSLLTGVYLNEEQRDKLKRGGSRALNDYVRAVQGEIKAQAAAGKISADSATANKLLKDSLIKVRDQFPELADQINGYLVNLDSIPTEKQTQAQVLIDEAMRQVDTIKGMLDSVARDYEAKIRVTLDASQAQEAMGSINGTIGDLSGLSANLQQGLFDTAQYASDEAAPSITGSMAVANQAVTDVNANIQAVTAIGQAAAQAVLKTIAPKTGYPIAPPGSANKTRLYDSGGVLHPGADKAVNAMNLTGNKELVFTREQLMALAEYGLSVGGKSAGGGFNGTINIYEQQNPKEWFDAALWEQARR